MEQPTSKQDGNTHHQQRDDSRYDQKLDGGFTCPLPVFLSNILGSHNRPSGGDRRKYIDQKRIDHIHQRHSRSRRFPHAGDHHRIYHSDRDRQDLLDDQRRDQTFQRPSSDNLLAAGSPVSFP